MFIHYSILFNFSQSHSSGSWLQSLILPLHCFVFEIESYSNVNAEKPNLIDLWLRIAKMDRPLWFITVKYWIAEMPIKMSKYWNIQEIITFFFLKCAFFCFLSHSEKNGIGLLNYPQSRTIHCSHIYLEWNLIRNSNLILKVTILLLLQTYQ